MEGLISKYKKAIEEMIDDIDLYKSLMKSDNCTEKEKNRCKELILFYRGKVEALSEVIEGKDINMKL